MMLDDVLQFNKVHIIEKVVSQQFIFINYTAKELFLKAANQGDSKAQFNLGSMYLFGEGLRQDYSMAKKWYLKAANQGNSKAQFNLGRMYYNGWGGRQDYSVAKELFGKSCDNGLQKGCDGYKDLNSK